MLKLNRTTEYGLMALTYIRTKPSGLSSAREIAEHFDLPFEILAKTLQHLKEEGLISSVQGTHGGYSLCCDLKKLNLTDFLEIMQGPSPLVTCIPISGKNGRHSKIDNCSYTPRCNIKHTMEGLNHKLYDLFSRISLDELTQSSYEGATAKTSTYGEEP